MTPGPRPLWLRVALSGLSGLALLAAFPPVDQRWVAFVALVPLLVALRGSSGRAGALLGAAFGLAFFGILIYWISYFGWLAWGALVAAQVGALALFGWFGAWASSRGAVLRVAGLPLLWTGVEMLRTRWPLGGFAWGGLGYTQHGGLPMLPLARLGGLFALSLALVLVNALLAEAVAGGGVRRRAVLAGFAAALVGFPALAPLGLAGPRAGAIDVAVVQGNVPRGTFTGFRGRGRVGPEDATIIENHVRLSQPLMGDPPGLAIWPENALDRDPFRNPDMMAAVQGIARAVGAPFLVGAILDAGPGHFRNSNVLFDAAGEYVARYDKLHLVPFGEYVPWHWLRRYISALEQVPEDGVPGRAPVVFDVGGARVGSVICFESTYPDLVRDSVRRGAEIIVVTTNNASFETSPAARQHLAMSQVRAVEHGRTVVHAAISGISALILPDGQITEESGLFEPALLRERLPLASGETPYTRFGGGIEIAFGAAAFLVALAGVAGRRRPSSRPPREREPAAGRRAAVVLPTYNEAGTIREVVARVLASTPEVDVIVVDDGSPDGTGAIVDEIAAGEPRVRVIHGPVKAGLGRAYIAGFRVALDAAYDAMLEMDSDLSHDPADIPRFLEALDDADFVIGSRYVPGGNVENWTQGRELLSRGGNAYARALLGFPLTDATSGFRCYRREVLETLPLDEVHSEGYAFQIEMAWRAWRAGFRVAEIPITFVERREGASKMSRRIAVEALWRVALWSATSLLVPRIRGRKASRGRRST